MKSAPTAAVEATAEAATTAVKAASAAVASASALSEREIRYKENKCE
jgi:hypothetical protein